MAPIINHSKPKEKKISSDNIGNKLLKNMGWKEGQGLGKDNKGIVEPLKVFFSFNILKYLFF